MEIHYEKNDMDVCLGVLHRNIQQLNNYLTTKGIFIMIHNISRLHYSDRMACYIKI